MAGTLFTGQTGEEGIILHIAVNQKLTYRVVVHTAKNHQLIHYFMNSW